MSTEIVTAGHFTHDQIELIKGQIMRGASNGELDLFLATCGRLRLDPFAKQIFAVKRYDPAAREERWVHQVSIDGHRVVAARSSEYEGQTEPQWCGPDGKWLDIWPDETRPPFAARVGVFKRGFREPVIGKARYSSYVQRTKDGTPIRNWQVMPDVMLAKCAEALALRKAFPNDLGGVTAPEENGFFENQRTPVAYQAPPPRTDRTVIDVEATPVERPMPANSDVVKSWGERIAACKTLDELAALRPELRTVSKGPAREVLVHAYQAQETYLREQAQTTREPGADG